MKSTIYINILSMFQGPSQLMYQLWSITSGISRIGPSAIRIADQYHPRGARDKKTNRSNDVFMCFTSLHGGFLSHGVTPLIIPYYRWIFHLFNQPAIPPMTSETHGPSGYIRLRPPMVPPQHVATMVPPPRGSRPYSRRPVSHRPPPRRSSHQPPAAEGCATGDSPDLKSRCKIDENYGYPLVI
jgi:hypothetical protein